MFGRTLMRNNSSATETQVQGLAFSLVSGGVVWTRSRGHDTNFIGMKPP